MERNHHEDSIIDEQRKRIACSDTRADTHCKLRALAKLASLQKRIKVVHNASSQGPYKPKTDEAPAPVSPLHIPSHHDANFPALPSNNNTQAAITLF